MNHTLSVVVKQSLPMREAIPSHAQHFKVTIHVAMAIIYRLCHLEPKQRSNGDYGEENIVVHTAMQCPTTSQLQP